VPPPAPALPNHALPPPALPLPALSASDFGAIRAVARAEEPDRYLAALLVGEPQRTGLLAVAAFSAELRRIPRIVTDPMIGEIRLQWWRDTIEAAAPDSRTGNPVADALTAAVQRHALPRALLLAMTEARAFDLYTDPMPDDASLDGYLDKTEGVPLELGFRIVAGRAPEPGEVATLTSIGRAYGLARLIGDLPHALARGSCPLPLATFKSAGISADSLFAGDVSGEISGDVRQLLKQLCAQVDAATVAVRQQVVSWPKANRRAVLPICVVPAYLKAALSQKRHPLREPVELLPLVRIWQIARGAMRR
jgi:15-cis-phytoene synthase